MNLEIKKGKDWFSYGRARSKGSCSDIWMTFNRSCRTQQAVVSELSDWEQLTVGVVDPLMLTCTVHHVTTVRLKNGAKRASWKPSWSDSCVQVVPHQVQREECLKVTTGLRSRPEVFSHLPSPYLLPTWKYPMLLLHKWPLEEEPPNGFEVEEKRL